MRLADCCRFWRKSFPYWKAADSTGWAVLPREGQFSSVSGAFFTPLGSARCVDEESVCALFFFHWVSRTLAAGRLVASCLAGLNWAQWSQLGGCGPPS